MEHIDIVPPVGTEGVDHERRAKDEPHLRTGHPRLEFGDHLLIDVISLLDIDLVRCERRQHRNLLAAGEQENHQNDSAHENSLGSIRIAARYLSLSGARFPKPEKANMIAEDHLRGEK